MEDRLSADEFDALEEVATAPRNERPSARVARNAKRLSGLKYIEYARNGALSLTDKGRQTLFIKHCIDGLRAIAGDPLAPLAPDVAAFLGKKGHIAKREGAEGYEATRRGLESLADIDGSDAS
ncbi:hypothetical protein D9O50_02140 [Oxalobacteraceae bacterium CAVE-383]|nr:hypothetical protein D9O50_02140 [Oxalobacteraceae bacterium CAVE-383]